MPFHSWFSKMKGTMKGAKERMNDSKKKSPDPFFTEWQRSSNASPNQKYYKDLMGKLFLFAGAVMFIRMLTGARGINRTISPELEEDYHR